MQKHVICCHFILSHWSCEETEIGCLYFKLLILCTVWKWSLPCSLKIHLGPLRTPKVKFIKQPSWQQNQIDSSRRAATSFPPQSTHIVIGPLMCQRSCSTAAPRCMRKHKSKLHTLPCNSPHCPPTTQSPQFMKTKTACYLLWFLGIQKPTQNWLGSQGSASVRLLRSNLPSGNVWKSSFSTAAGNNEHMTMNNIFFQILKTSPESVCFLTCQPVRHRSWVIE